jgi:hypothetical protein
MTKPSHNIRPVVALLLLSVTCAAARGQQAYKIDETEYTRCDLAEVPYVTDPPMPIFVELGKHPEARAAVVVYSTRPGDGMIYALRIKRWLTEVRGVVAERVVAVYGGYAGKRRLEIWLVPAGAEPPLSAPPVTRVGVTLFERYSDYMGEACPDNRLPALEAFAEALKRLPGWRGTIVLRPHVNRRGVRTGDEDFDYAPLTRRQALSRAAADRLHLVRQLGLEPARIRAVVGAPDSWAHGELWLIPPAPHAPGVR